MYKSKLAVSLFALSFRIFHQEGASRHFSLHKKAFFPFNKLFFDKKVSNIVCSYKARSYFYRKIFLCKKNGVIKICHLRTP